MIRLPIENLEKNVIFDLSFCPLLIWALKTCNKDEKFCKQDISKTITARSFKISQLIEDGKRLNLIKKINSYFISSRYFPMQSL